MTVVLTTQYLDEADRLADRIAVLDDGRIVAEGTAGDLKQQGAAQRLDVTLDSDMSFSAVLAEFGSRVLQADAAGRRLGLSTTGEAAEVRHLLDELDPTRSRVSSFEVHTATLDDVFMTLTGHRTDKEPADV